MLAVPVLSSDAAPNELLPFMKVTLPVGVALAVFATVADSVTASSTLAGSGVALAVTWAGEGPVVLAPVPYSNAPKVG